MYKRTIAFIILCLLASISFFSAHAWASCSAPGNAVEAENCLAGTPQSTWDIVGSGDATIQGFADNISVNVGQMINFKIKTTAAGYHLDIYRMGYYQGNGARLVTTIQPTATLPQIQPSCVTNASVGLYDCGNWVVSATWSVPSTAVSGIYFARIIRNDTLGASHIVFIVRNDASHSNILFQASDTTWQAYNDSINGQNLYTNDTCGQWVPACRSYKVSYNRPFNTRVFESDNWVFNAEYPMVRWLEANGYDVTYFTDTDTDRLGSLILNHKMWISNGHDEYWSGQQRANIENARNAGVHLGFFSGNTMFWKTRWENSIDGTNTPNRTLVCYKETFLDVTDPLDPTIWTGTWRDPRLSPPADGGRPENAVKGNIFQVNGDYYSAITVPAASGKMRFWRNTPVATLSSGSATLAQGSLGAEVDGDIDNGFRPAGLIQLSSNSITDPSKILLDYGITYGAGTMEHKVVLYRYQSSGALVFSTGTYDWSWGLDNHHDNSSQGAITSAAMQQATVNLFADMGVQPVSLQSGLTLASASTDIIPPVSTITSPTTGSTVTTGAVVTISGTASDTNGVIGGVEVSTDGGTTWHPATGQGIWTYSWIASGSSAVIRSRAVDDSGNLETPAGSTNVTVIGGGGSGCTSNCRTIWTSASTPIVTDQGPDSSVELGVKFRSDVAGTITGIRFYKASTNTGAHVGNLWSSTGTKLASATFSGETASGWQQVNFASPVAITANTVYVASYHANAGHYSIDSGYFTSTGHDNPPLHALANGVSGGDGVYIYGATSAFPALTFNSTNYWVDVAFTPMALMSLAVTPANPAILIGVTQPFTATGTYSDGSTQNLTTQSIWVSSNTAATINASGVATGVSAASTTITATSGGVSGNTTLTVNAAPVPLSITTSSLPAGIQGVIYPTTALTAIGGNPPYTAWSISSGALPAGLSLTSAGAITGTPTTAGTFSFTVQVTDSSSPSGTSTKALSMTVAGALTITTSSLPAGAQGVVYPATALTATGGNPPTAWSISSGALPAGLSLTSIGTITGTPTVSGTFSFTAQVTDSATPTPSVVTKALSITVAATQTNITLWPGTALPGLVDGGPDKAVELGVKFRSDVAGKITGIRFYKAGTNTGTHIGNLWSSTGTKLATVTFSVETASGWQQMLFSTPVAISANTVYVASYHTNVGHYSADINYFSLVGLDNPPLHALARGVSGGDGVYAYGATSAFPTLTWLSANYWVDVVFITP